ncbi:MAG: SpoIIE family protein phosphatase [Candidatus Theseobacter exili]|nr:SpoIIE family protein phosphatase [Candidatus Theseobacter exili]
MKLRTRLLIYTVLVCLVMAVLIGFFGIDDLITTGKKSSDLATSEMKKIGATVISDISHHVAENMDDYLKLHPGIRTIEQIKSDKYLSSLAIQRVGITGYTDVYDTNGLSIFHPNPKVVGKNYSGWKDLYPSMWDLVEKSLKSVEVSGYYSFIDLKGNPREKYMCIVPVRNTPLLVCATTYIDEFFSPMESISHQIHKMTKQSIIRFLAGMLFVVGLSIPVAIWISSQFTRPILKLIETSDKIGKGNLDVNIDFHAPEEIQRLAESMREMGRNLQRYIQRLEQTTREKERMSGELQYAFDIQRSLLPQGVTRMKMLEIAGINRLAGEPDGGFYDFVKTDNGEIVMMMGEGASRGLESILYAVRMRSGFRVLATEKEVNPVSLVERMNEILFSIGRPFQMSCLFAVVDSAKGCMKYSSAGDFTLITSSRDEKMIALEGDSLGAAGKSKISVGEICLREGDLCAFVSNNIFHKSGSSNRKIDKENIVSFLTKQNDADLDAVTKSFQKLLGDVFGDNPLSRDLLAVFVKSCESRVEIQVERSKGWSGNFDLILQRLFNDCSQVKLTAISGGYSGSFIFKVEARDLRGNFQMPYILKLGRWDLIQKEKDGYLLHVSKYIQNNATQVVNWDRVEDSGGVLYNFVGMSSDEEGIISLYDFYSSNEKEKVTGVLEQLFRHVLKTWYGQPRLEDMSLYDFYGKIRFYPMIQGYLKKYQKVTPEMKEVNLGRIKQTSVNPLFFVESVMPHRIDRRRQVYEATIHGDLNLKNIMMDGKKNLWLIDFSETRTGHILADFAKLESSILCDVISVTEENFDELIRMIKCLFLVNSLNEIPKEFSTDNKTIEKAFIVIKKIREYVNLVTGLDNDIEQYLLGLFHYTMCTMGYKNVDYILKEFAFYYCSLLADRLMEY